MKAFLSFLTSKRFFIHLALSLTFCAVVAWVFFNYLGNYTRHNQSIAVPDFKDIKVEELDKFAAENKLQYQILDSVFEAKADKGVVIKQDPEKDSQVKENRIIYLTISAKRPPLIKMPNLVDVSLRQALSLIESYGLKVGRKDYKKDACVNCVLEQRMKGKKIEPGATIPKGSTIDLLLGQGTGEGITPPCLIGQTKADAIKRITESGMKEGSMICTDCKTSADKFKAKVYRQVPNCSSDNVLPGSAINLYFGLKAASTYKDDNDE